MFSLFKFIQESGQHTDDIEDDSLPEAVNDSTITNIKSDIPFSDQIHTIFKSGTAAQIEWALIKIHELSQSELFDPRFFDNLISQFQSDKPRVQLACLKCFLEIAQKYPVPLSQFVLRPLLNMMTRNKFAIELLQLFQVLMPHFTDQQFVQLFATIDACFGMACEQQMTAIIILCIIPSDKFKPGDVTLYFKEIAKVTEYSDLLQSPAIHYCVSFLDVISNNDLFSFIDRTINDANISDDCALDFIRFAQIFLNKRFAQFHGCFPVLISKIATSNRTDARTCLPMLIAKSPNLIRKCDSQIIHAIMMLVRDPQPSVRQSLVSTIPVIFDNSTEKMRLHIIDLFMKLFDDPSPDVQNSLIHPPQIRMLLINDPSRMKTLFDYMLKFTKKWRMVSQFLQSMMAMPFEIISNYINALANLIDISFNENPFALCHIVAIFYKGVLKNSSNAAPIIEHILKHYGYSQFFAHRRFFLVLSSIILLTIPNQVAQELLLPRLFELAADKIVTVQYAFLKYFSPKMIEFMSYEANLIYLNVFTAVLNSFMSSKDPHVLELLQYNLRMMEDRTIKSDKPKPAKMVPLPRQRAAPQSSAMKTIKNKASFRKSSVQHEKSKSFLMAGKGKVTGAPKRSTLPKL